MFEPASPVGAMIATPAGGLGVNQFRVWCQDDALAGLAQPQAIVDIVERHREAAIVHSADGEIVVSSGYKTSRGHRAAFVRHKKLIEKARVIAEPVREGMRDRKVHAQHHA